MTVKVGLLFPLSGDWAWVGQPCLHAVRTAREFAKERGAGDVDLLVGDVASPEVAVREAERLCDLGANVLFGSMFSSHSFPMSDVAAKRGVVFWEAVAAADELTQRGHARFFRLDTTCAAYGAKVAEFVAERLAPSWSMDPGAVRVGVASAEEPFCRSMGDAMMRAANARGLQVVGRERFPFPGKADIAGVVSRLARVEPDVVFMTSFGPAVTEFGKLARRELRLRALIGNGAWALQHRVGELGAALDGVFSVDTPHVSSLRETGLSEAGRARLQGWKERCGEPHSVRTAVDRDLVFIASNVLFEHVLPRARSGSPDDIASAARDVDIGVGEHILGYGTRFTRTGENERAFAVLMQWQDGVRHTVDPERFATSRARTEPLAVA